MYLDDLDCHSFIMTNCCLVHCDLLCDLCFIILSATCGYYDAIDFLHIINNHINALISFLFPCVYIILVSPFLQLDIVKKVNKYK